ncbi:MAG: hypothetical protein U5L03_00420 [Burkholderiaceae bacterium]|nr:hypothetical protein [Burkholderiaceae bacterium]
MNEHVKAHAQRLKKSECGGGSNDQQARGDPHVCQYEFLELEMTGRSRASGKMM